LSPLIRDSRADARKPASIVIAGFKWNSPNEHATHLAGTKVELRMAKTE
jgi:hypothetical protein